MDPKYYYIVLSILGGAIIGYFVGLYRGKTIAYNEMNGDLESIRRDYMAKLDKYEAELDEIRHQDMIKTFDDVEDNLEEGMSIDEVREEYRKIAKSYDDPDLDDHMADREYPTEDDDEDEDEDVSVKFIPEENIYQPRRKTPYVISSSDYELTCLYYDKLNLYYYEEDDVLCDDQEELVTDSTIISPDALESFGRMSNDKDTVFIRNESLGADFELVRIHGSYAKDVLGI